MLTDQQAVSLFEDMRHTTQSVAVAALCDWALALARRQQEAVAFSLAIVAARKAHRREYMRDFMRRRRAAARAARADLGKG